MIESNVVRIPSTRLAWLLRLSVHEHFRRKRHFRLAALASTGKVSALKC